MHWLRRHLRRTRPGEIMSQSQESLMLFDPATGEQKPYPSHAEQWRIFHGPAAWLFNPWFGNRRDARDVGTDCFGYLIAPTSEPLRAAAKTEGQQS
jgi:hypothetical protein